ncbi:hypothetical protein MPSEU_000836500 [Mayamaea pseudoterrestris]|nr:hypothetical protein MPSEU_000836500 [Mayamaea pseudoterrestris]
MHPPDSVDTITLYRSNSKVQEADELRSFLSSTQYSFVEKNVSDHPDYHSELIKQFGGQLSFPGICIYNQFVPLDEIDFERLQSNKDWLEYLLQTHEQGSCASASSKGDKMISNKQGSSPKSAILRHGSKPSASSSFDWVTPKLMAATDTAPVKATNNVPKPFKPPLEEFTKPIKQLRALSLGSANTGISELSSGCSAIVCEITLPNKQGNMTVADVTRKLLGVVRHSVLRDHNGKQWYYCRGQHVLQVVKQVFFQNSNKSTKEAVDEQEVLEFANQLVDRDIFIDWTPECNDFSSTFLVMYHYCQPHVLNTLIKWPASDDERSDDSDPMNVILRLSRDMDEICIWENYQRKDKVFAALYKSLEEKICQLQVIQFPEDSLDRVTFGLNLFNLIIRHAMIMAPKRQWSWPQSVEEFDLFTHQIGYDIGGEIVTLAYLRDSLHGTKGQAPVSLVAETPSLWERLSCQAGAAKHRDVHYERKVVCTDSRILFATTWGCHSSPTASTVYPYQLSEGLRTAAEMYCQQHVIVRGNRVILPAMLGWYRADFGGDPESIVINISRFLLPDQLALMVDLNKQGIKLKIAFDDCFDWQPGIAAPAKDIDFQFATKDFPSATLPAFACENGTLAGNSISAGSRASFVSRISKIMPSIPLFGRQSSDGESEVKPRMRTTIPSLPSHNSPGTDNDESVCENYYDEDGDDDNTTHNPDTIVSALTLGSEFGDIRFQADRSKKSYQRLTPSATLNHHHASQQQFGAGTNVGYGYASGLY